MTPEQKREAASLIGKMPREEIAKEIGASISDLKRAFRGRRLAFHNKYIRNPALVKQVCAFYEAHGRQATEKAFPGVKVRSIVERYKYFGPRTVRWTDEQIIEASKMAGLISFKAQAQYFKRPNAFEGSIKSLWHKRFKFGMQTVHGMSHYIGRELVTKECPYVVSKFWGTKRKGKHFGRKLFLWTDMEKHLKPEVPTFIKDAIVTLADFQRWLYQTKNPKRQIMHIIKSREVA